MLTDTAPRRTGSTPLNEVDLNVDWIETCLVHEDGRSSRSVYDKAEHAEPRRRFIIVVKRSL